MLQVNRLAAQAYGYSFTPSAGTYTPITGGTQLNATIPDSWVSGAITLSPAFTFAGVSYTTAYCTSNGLITLGGAAPSTTQYNAINATTGSGIAICPFNADLEASVATGAAPEIRFETVGNEHVFQWTDATRYAYGDRVSIQARLNTTNGQIKFVYGTGTIVAGTNTGRQPIIGIRTATTDYKSLTVGTGTELWDGPLPGTTLTSNMRFTSTAPAKTPNSGQTYTFSPPTCLWPTAVSIGTIATTSAIATFTSTGTSFIVEYGPVGFTPGTGATPGTGGTIVTGSASPITITGLTQNTAYDVYIRTNCTSSGNGYSVNSPVVNFTTLQACPTPTALAIGSITPTSASASFTGTGTNYIVEYGPVNFTPGTGSTAGTGGTIVTGTSSPISLPGLTPSTSYDVYVRSNCTGAGNGFSANSAKVNFSTLCQAPTLLTTTAGFRCGPGTVILGATVSQPGNLNWYSAATGGTILATGTSFTTPSISANTTYYVAPASTSFVNQTYSVGYLTSANYSFLTQTVGWGHMFTVNLNCTFDSVGVFPTGTGTITIKILDPSNNILYTGPTVSITGTGTTKVMVPVGASLAPGNYKLGMSSTGVTNLGSQTTGGTFAYPFVSPPLTITSGSQGSGAVAAVYYWFYDWRITTSVGCEGTRTAVLATVNTKPDTTVNVTGNTTFCQGGSATLNAATGLTYQWLLNNNIIAGATSVTYNVSAAGSYRVKVSNATCTDTSSARVITVLPKPVATVAAGGPTTFCAGDSVKLRGPLYTTGTNYQWQLNGVNITGATDTMYTVFNSGDYRLVLFNSTCSDTSTVTTVTVKPLPTVGVSPATAAVVCAGTGITLTANGANTYSWSPATGLNTTTGATVVATPGTTTTYTVTGIAANGCSATATKTVTVNSVPVVGINPSSATICLGDSILLTANGAATYSWSPATGLTVTTGQSIYAHPTTTTTYTVVGDDGIGCTASSSIVVTVNPVPAINVTPATAITVCAGVSSTLTANGGISYNWSPATGLNTATGATVIATPTTTTTYTVRGFGANGCSSIATKLITINALPALAIIPATVAICIGSSQVLSASGASTYSWSPTTNLTPTTGANVTASPTTTTTYTVTGTGTNGCTATLARTVTVTAIPTPNITPAVAPSVCAGSSVTLTANGGTTYSWSPATGLSSTNTATTIATPTTTTTYTVTATTNGCSGIATKTVTVNPLPTATITAAGTTSFCTGGSVVLNANTGTGLAYTWRTNGAPNGVTTASYTATASGTYDVIVSNGTCTNTSNAILVNASAAPVTTVTPAGSTTFCQGGSVVLNAVLNAGYTYQWQLGGSPITGANAASYTATTTGNYSVVIINGTCTGTSGITPVTVNSNPPAAVLPQGATTFCEGGAVTLFASIGTGYTYQWQLNGGAIPGANNATYVATASGDYGVTVTNGLTTCTSQATPVTVQVVAATTPVITVNGAVLSTGNYAAYQWYRNGVAIPGANSKDYTVTQDGSYTVEVTILTGCTRISQPVTISNLSVGGVGTTSVTFYPNPAATMITIVADKTVNISLSSLDGKEVLRQTEAKTVDIRNLADGVYMLRITDKAGQLVKIDRLIKTTR